jgi:hypothetical protein
MQAKASCGPERRGRFKATDMTKRGFVTKFVLSCACAECTSLRGEGSAVRGSVYRADADATYADDSPRTAEGFCGTHVGRVVAVESKDG